MAANYILTKVCSLLHLVLALPLRNGVPESAANTYKMSLSLNFPLSNDKTL